MKELKGTKTEKNLMEAFAGESQARNKYTYFASKAKKEGYQQIAALFEETADAREIARLKKELATVRAVLRSYVIEIDSLNRLNQNLTAENTRIKGQYNEATRQIEGLNTERATLSEKVAIAAQLDATGISMQLKNKRGKNTDKTSKCTNIQVNFTIAKNVTARNGQKTFYVRITTPAGTTLGGGFCFRPFATKKIA